MQLPFCKMLQTRREQQTTALCDSMVLNLRPVRELRPSCSHVSVPLTERHSYWHAKQRLYQAAHPIPAFSNEQCSYHSEFRAWA